MGLKNLKKEDLELLSNKDITDMILEEKGAQNTATLFKKIIKLLNLPESVFDEKIGDYYTSLTTDKRFILLDDGKWDLRSRHTSDKLVKIVEEEEEEEMDENKEDDEEEEDEISNFDSMENEDEMDDTDEDLKDLVVLDEDELELEQ